MLTLHIFPKQVGKQVAVEMVHSKPMFIRWSANTVINSISLEDFAGTEYYLIEFNNPASGDQ